MSKILPLLVVLCLAFLALHGWGGQTYYRNYGVPVPESELDTRIAFVPFRVWKRVVPGFDQGWSVHYEPACWMLPFERYTVLSDRIEGLVYVESGRCNGNANVAPIRY